MFETQKYLELVRERGEAGKALSRVYRGIRRRNLFLMAYANLYANGGALTPGIDRDDTVDGMNALRLPLRDRMRFHCSGFRQYQEVSVRK